MMPRLNPNVRHVTIRFNGNEILDIYYDSGDILLVMHSIPDFPTSVYTDAKHLLLQQSV